MSISVRVVVAAGMFAFCQIGWAQFPIEGTIVENSVFPAEGTIIDGGIVNEGFVDGGFVSSGAVDGGVVYADSQIPVSGQIVSGSNVSYSVPSNNVSTVSYNAPAAGGGILDVVNQKRRRSGLSALAYDAGLTQTAQNKSNIRANRRITGHDGSARGGARVEGVGYAYGGNLTQRFNTCYLYSNGYSRAGAAIAYDNSGRAYYTLLLR